MKNLDIELSLYEVAIENLAKTGAGTVFPNSGKEHASLVFSKIFKYAKREVLMFSGSLNGDVSNDDKYLHELSNYLRRNGKFKLILEKNPGNESRAFSIIKEHISKENVSVTLMDFEKPEVKNFFGKEEINHWIVADGKMYRFEIDIKNYSALCSFNDPKLAANITSGFNVLASTSKPLEVA